MESIWINRPTQLPSSRRIPCEIAAWNSAPCRCRRCARPAKHTGETPRISQLSGQPDEPSTTSNSSRKSNSLKTEYEGLDLQTTLTRWSKSTLAYYAIVDQATGQTDLPLIHRTYLNIYHTRTRIVSFTNSGDTPMTSNHMRASGKRW